MSTVKASNLTMYKTNAELDALPALPWLFGCGEVVVEDMNAPRKKEWMYSPWLGPVTKEKCIQKYTSNEYNTSS